MNSIVCNWCGEVMDSWDGGDTYHCPICDDEPFDDVDFGLDEIGVI